MADSNPSQVDTPSGQEPQTTNQQPGADDGQQLFDQKYVASIRQEAAANRLKVKALEAELAKFQDAQLSDKERLEKLAATAQQELTEHRQRLQALSVEKAIILEATKQGLAPDLAVRLVDVQLDADGKPTAVAEAVKATIEAYPQLISNGKPASTTTPANPATKTKKATLTRADIAIMSPAEINTRWDEISAVLKS